MNSVAAVESARAVKKREWGNVAIPVLVALVAAFGVLMVYSASYYTAETQFGDEFYFMKKQLVGFILGLVAMLAAGFFPYAKLKKLKWPALIVSLVLLAAVFVPGLGVENYGATRWIGLGPITIQPSEIAKFGFVIFAAAYASEKPERMKKFVGMLPVLAAGAGICVLIIAEPNMSVTMCVGLLMVAMLFLSGVKIRHFLVILLPIALAVPVLIIMEPYRMQRLYAFLDPWSSPQGEGYQLIQSLYALGSGGWFGVGLFNSRQKYLFLPFAESDFIFSVIGEELGLAGAICVLCVYIFIIVRIVAIAQKAPDREGSYLAGGIAAVIAVQTLINVAVVTGSIPPTGVPLPFVSAGSSSLIAFCAAIGMVLNIKRQSVSLR